MLQVLRGHGLTDVCAVVIRYFGGTLLGRGGLIKAYTESVAKAVEQAGIKEFVQVSAYSIEFPYPLVSVVENLLQKYGQITERIFDEKVIICFKSENMDIIREELINVCRGQVTINHLSTQWE